MEFEKEQQHFLLAEAVSAACGAMGAVSRSLDLMVDAMGSDQLEKLEAFYRAGMSIGQSRMIDAAVDTLIDSADGLLDATHSLYFAKDSWRRLKGPDPEMQRLYEKGEEEALRGPRLKERLVRLEEEVAEEARLRPFLTGGR